jgi:hypothetical protein
MRKAADLTVTAFKTIVMFLVKLPGNFFYYITHPTERKERLASLKQLARDEAHHYWVGTKVCIKSSRQETPIFACFLTVIQLSS